MALTLTNFGVHSGSVYCKRHLALQSSHRASSFRERSSTMAVASKRPPLTKSPSMSQVTAYAPSSGASTRGRTLATSQRDSTATAAPVGRHMRSPSMVIRSKTTICVICSKAAYPTESVKVDQLTYHKRCFKCVHCKCRLTMQNFAMINTNAYCKPHFKQLFQSSGGKYDRAFGSIWDNSSDPKGRSNTVIRKSYVPPVESGGVFSGTAEAISPSHHRTAAAKAGPKTLPRSIRLNPRKSMTSPPLSQPVAKPTKFEARSLPCPLDVKKTKLNVPTRVVTSPPFSFKTPVMPPAAPTAAEPKKKVTLVAMSAAVGTAPTKPKKKVTIDLPPAPTSSPPPEPTIARTAPARRFSPSLKVSTPAVASAKAEDPVTAFFRALKSNNTKTLTTALAALARHKKLGVVVSPSSHLTNMTPVEYAYVTRKIPLARVLVDALKEHFDAV